MAGSYHGQVHEENLKRLEEFHQVSKKNRYRKCLVTCSEKNPKGRTRKVQRKALFHKWDEIKQVIDASPMIGGHPRRPDSVHIGNCGIYGRNRGTGISGIYKIPGY